MNKKALKGYTSPVPSTPTPAEPAKVLPHCELPARFTFMDGDCVVAFDQCEFVDELTAQAGLVTVTVTKANGQTVTETLGKRRFDNSWEMGETDPNSLFTVYFSRVAKASK